MRTNKKAVWRRWMLALGTAAVLCGGGAAYAMRKDCWQCAPCGCGTDGGQLLCCGVAAC
ncbi:hypothetical protein [Archangium primigenium]|uniref:hypothetical protein n=1 Tax=Melittangium TaxID=44 RepID=UPI00195A1EF9|nr:hypothetical protein [Archangium primigenium]MBM7112250.1 hypothetical protein [Archangium primigenium]